MRRIRFASTNPIKLAEAGEIILGLEALTLDLPEIQSTDPAVVVRHKLASVAALGLEDPVIVEDTGLAIDSWGGLPGALVKWFVERWGAAQLAHISHIDGRGRGAEAVSAVGVLHYGDVRVWSGRIRGRIVEPRGDLAGWTPIFEVDGSGKTLAEMDFAERMSVTMRRAPLMEARDWLAERGLSSSRSDHAQVAVSRSGGPPPPRTPTELGEVVARCRLNPLR